MTNEQLRQLLEKMSIEEKIGQLQQLSGDFFLDNSSEITGPMLSEHGLDKVDTHLAGSVLGVSGAKDVYRIQKEYMDKHPNQIPLLFMADVVHGYETIFPIPLALSSSWNPNLIRQISAVAAKEAAVSGLHVTFAPMLDLAFDPRWGRVLESTGEDPYLGSVLAKAYVEGFQRPENQKEYLAACLKHFAGYGASEGGRDYNSVDISHPQLRNDYFPAFKAGIEAEAKMVMTSFNTWQGVPSSSNKKLLRDELRDHLQFDGVLISDWGAVLEAVPHGIAENDYDAAYLSMQAGVDIEMMTFTYQKHLKELIEEGKIQMTVLDEAVWRILSLKNDLGLFENPYAFLDEHKEKEIILCDKHREIAYQAALESMVLLENRNETLPLSEDENIAFVGPLVNVNDLMGAWSWRGKKEDVKTIEEVMSAYPTVSMSYDFDVERELEKIEKSLSKENIETIVLVLGEPSEWSGEAASRSNITLPENQQRLYAAIRERYSEVVVVLINGRPLDLTGISETADAILEAYYPGTEGARAMQSILFGKANPSGKLSMSFPYHVGQVPVYYRQENTGRPSNVLGADPKYTSKYLDVPNEPRYSFGYGLTYSNMYVEDLRLSKSHFETHEPVQASVKIKNPSDYAGYETVQWYIRDHVADVVRPMKELIGFEKVWLEAKSEKEVQIQIDFEDLAYYNQNLVYKADPGNFTLMVGLDTQQILNETFEYIIKD